MFHSAITPARFFAWLTLKARGQAPRPVAAPGVQAPRPRHYPEGGVLAIAFETPAAPGHDDRDLFARETTHCVPSPVADDRRLML